MKPLTTARWSRVMVTVLAFAALLAGGTAPASAAAEPPDDGAPTSCLVIYEQGRGSGTLLYYAHVRNDCGREVNATVQISFWPDPGCQRIAAGGWARFTWIPGVQEATRANYAYEC